MSRDHQPDNRKARKKKSNLKAALDSGVQNNNKNTKKQSVENNDV